MHTHPGLFYYPSLHENGRIRFPLINPACDRPTSHLSRYITASYLLNYELARELSRARVALAAAHALAQLFLLSSILLQFLPPLFHRRPRRVPLTL